MDDAVEVGDDFLSIAPLRRLEAFQRRQRVFDTSDPFVGQIAIAL